MVCGPCAPVRRGRRARTSPAVVTSTPRSRSAIEPERAQGRLQFRLRHDAGAAAGERLGDALVDVDRQAAARAAQAPPAGRSSSRRSPARADSSQIAFPAPRHETCYSLATYSLEECHGDDHEGQEGSNSHVDGEWPAALKAEFAAREPSSRTAASAPSCCPRPTRCGCGPSGSTPGERIGFHRHVLNYFWTSVNGGRGRQHLMDGTTVEYSYFPGETRHETYGGRRIQGARSGEPRRPGHDLHDGRVDRERQQAAADARSRPPEPFLRPVSRRPATAIECRRRMGTRVIVRSSGPRGLSPS